MSSENQGAAGKTYISFNPEGTRNEHLIGLLRIQGVNVVGG